MNKMYIAPNKCGDMVKIVFDVDIPGQWEKLKDMGYGNGMPKKGKVLIARFTNEELAKKFLDAYNRVYP